MANILKVTPEEVSEKAKAISTVKESMESLLNDLNSRIGGMVQSDWIGNAGSAYENQFLVLYNQIIKSLDVIQQHANNLSQAAARYQDSENERVTNIGALDSTDIF